MSDLKAIVAKLRQPTHGTYRVHDWLTGPHMARLRCEVMGDLLGQRVPQSKAGITALVTELYRRAGIAGNCGAARENAFARFAAETLGDTEYLERVDREEREYLAKYGPDADDILGVDVSASLTFRDKAAAVLKRIPLCSAAGMAVQLGITVEHGAELLAELRPERQIA